MYFSETCEYLRGHGYTTQRRMPQRQMRKLYEKMKYLAKQGRLSKTQFKEIETDGGAKRIKKRVERPPVIGEKDLPSLEMRNCALDGGADRADLVIVFVFSRVKFAVLWLLRRRDVAVNIHPGDRGA